METQFRPFNMCVLITDANVRTVTLKDTAGVALKCNYISIAPSGNQNTAYKVGIDVPGQVTTVAQSSALAVSMNLETSGWVGTVGMTRNGAASTELLLADGDRTSVINIQQEEAKNTQYLITYGQIQCGNTIRDNNRNQGQ